MTGQNAFRFGQCDQSCGVRIWKEFLRWNQASGREGISSQMDIRSTAETQWTEQVARDWSLEMPSSSSLKTTCLAP